VGVLGSTPEFRDLLVEMGFTRIYVFDNNIGSYERMSRLRIYSGQEEFVFGHWLETLPTFDGELAVLLSDLTSGNLTYEERADFYCAITRALSHEGLFIDKVLTHPTPHLDLNELEEKYRRRALNIFELNRFSCEFFFCSQLLGIVNVVDTNLFYSELDNRLSHPRLRAFLREVPKVTPRDCIWYYGRSWDLLEGDYCRDLHPSAVFEDEDGSPYKGRLKLFILRKK